MATAVNLWTQYDEDADIFYARLRSDVQDATTQEADHGVLIDRDPATGEVVGIEILDFLGHFAALKDLSWLSPFGIPPEVLPLLRQKAHECQQTSLSGSISHSS
jgi:uncharacterized protein YuzE